MFDATIQSEQPISIAFKEEGLGKFSEALEFVKSLPYGRNASRGFEAVLRQRRGTCSSKHALLRKLAIENGWNQVQLVMVIYAMSQDNTPGIGKTLSPHRINFIPEAHCVLKVDGQFLDVTSQSSDTGLWSDAVLANRVIEPEDILHNKGTWHRAFLKGWLEQNELNYTLDEIWEIRESCIRALSKE